MEGLAISALTRSERIVTAIVCAYLLLPFVGGFLTLLLGPPVPSWLAAFRESYAVANIFLFIFLVGGLFWLARRTRTRSPLAERDYWTPARIENWETRRAKGRWRSLLTLRALLGSLGSISYFLVATAWVDESPILTPRKVGTIPMWLALIAWFQLSRWKSLEKRYLAFTGGVEAEGT